MEKTWLVKPWHVAERELVLCIVSCLCLSLLTPKTGCKAAHLLFTCIREQRGGKTSLFQWQKLVANPHC